MKNGVSNDRATGAAKPAIREVLDDGPCRIKIRPRSWFVKGKQVRLMGRLGTRQVARFFTLNSHSC